MPEKISTDVVIDNTNFAGSIVLNGISHFGFMENNPEFSCEKMNAEGRTFEVCLTINGKEVPFTEVVNKTVGNYEEQIKKEALKLIKNKFSDVYEKMLSAERAIEDLIQNA